MLTEDFDAMIKRIADDGKLGGIYLATPTGEVWEEDRTYLEVIILGKSFFAKPCMPFGTINVPNKEWLAKYKDEIFVGVCFENGNPAHPVYMGVMPRDGKSPEGNFPRIKTWKSTEFQYTFDDQAETFLMKTIGKNGGNQIKITKDIIEQKSRQGQKVSVSDKVRLGKGDGKQSAVLGEKYTDIIKEAIDEVSSALQKLSGDVLVVTGATASHSPAAIAAVAVGVSKLTAIKSKLSTALSADVKLD